MNQIIFKGILMGPTMFLFYETEKLVKKYNFFLGFTSQTFGH